jgi:hypothetical protein
MFKRAKEPVMCGLQLVSIMYPQKKVDADPVWKYEELPPADLVKSLHLEPAAINHDEFSRADWFWSRRPKVLSESVSFFFFYLTVAVCLFYLLPGTVPFLLLWLVAGASCAFADGIRLNRWRKEYESSITRVVIHLSERK